MALWGLADYPVAISAIEHASVMNAVPQALHLPVSEEGLLDMEALERFLREQDRPVLVSVMLANNETGVIQPVGEIARLVHRYGSVLHCDAAQALGKIPVDLTLLGADLVSFCGHKLGAPPGVGALFISQSLELTPLMRGGGQELKRRPGTENVAAVAGLVTAFEHSHAMAGHFTMLRDWLDEMEAACTQRYPEEPLVLGQGAPRLPNTTALRMPGVSSETQLMQFDLAGFAISAGSACSSGRIEPSHVARAMLGADAPDDVIRISGGWQTTQQDVQALTDQWVTLAPTPS
jgi:cysteine desulfurase